MTKYRALVIPDLIGDPAEEQRLQNSSAASGLTTQGAIACAARGPLMQMFEYVVVLISIVIGLALTHLMQRIAGLIQHPARGRVWWVHLVWVAYMFLSIVFWWWWEFQLQRIHAWTFAIYLF